MCREWQTAMVRESQVRDALVARIHRTHAHDPATHIVHELGLCQAEARVDLAVINGRFTGWEIKTDADTLGRLPAQAQVYSRVFDRVWLAADVSHINAALPLIPPWWGVLGVSERRGACQLSLVRPSRLNPSVDLSALVRLLWRAEVLAELTALGLAYGMDRKPRTVLWDALAAASPARISAPQLRGRVRTQLTARDNWRAAPLHS